MEICLKIQSLQCQGMDLSMVACHKISCDKCKKFHIKMKNIMQFLRDYVKIANLSMSSLHISMPHQKRGTIEELSHTCVL